MSQTDTSEYIQTISLLCLVFFIFHSKCLIKLVYQRAHIRQGERFLRRQRCSLLNILLHLHISFRYLQNWYARCLVVKTTVCLVTFSKSQHNIAPYSSLGKRLNINKVMILHLHCNEFNLDRKLIGYCFSLQMMIMRI